MHTVNIDEAKINLASLLEEAISGKDVIIAKSGDPIVRLVPVQRDTQPRTPGRFKGQISIAPDFDQIPEDILNAFEGKSE